MHCPYCKSHDCWRLQPLPWMRRIRPRFKNRRCSNCGHEFAVWMRVFSMKHRTGQKIVFLYLVLLAALVVLLAGDLYRWYARPNTSWLHRGYEAVCDLVAPQTATPVRRSSSSANPDAPPTGPSPY